MKASAAQAPQQYFSCHTSIFTPSTLGRLRNSGRPKTTMRIKRMIIETDLASNECHFENCIHFEDQVCKDRESREYCIEIALAVLNVERETDGDK